jgi:hypothetical protein
MDFPKLSVEGKWTVILALFPFGWLMLGLPNIQTVGVLCWGACVLLLVDIYWPNNPFREFLKWRTEKKGNSLSLSITRAEPNLVFKTPLMGGGLTCQNNVWTQGYSDTLRYIAWRVPIKNEAIPGKEVGKAERITAEIVLSSGGTSLLEVSPAPWVGEASRKIDIQSPDTKELLVAFKESVSGCGYWEMDFHGIPMGCSRGELKIRLLRERDSGTSYLATKFYKWKRAPELGDFWIEER